ncbi:hypothetical protein DP144_02575 [Clostridium tetani]|nr:hypothetical protein DP133_05595 [Clostridium tetani]RYU99767.1 hypothetical protein DP144_02575 [Clostridium tetani]
MEEGVVDRSKLRKILYLYSIVIVMISVIILTTNQLKNIEIMYKKDVESLYNNAIQLKKKHIKNIIDITVKHIDRERINVTDQFDNNIDYIINSLQFHIKEDELNIENILKIKDRNEYDLLVWDNNKNKLNYISDKLLLNKSIKSEEEFINYIKKYKVNKYKSLQNKIIAIVVREDTIEKKVQNIIMDYVRKTELSVNEYMWINQALDDLMLKGEVISLKKHFQKQIINSIIIAISLILILILVIFVFEKRYYKIINKYYNTIIREKQELVMEKTKVENEYKRLESIAITDPLTNLYNRYFTMNYLQSQFLRFQEKEVNFNLAMGDIDYFKNVNDTYGHEAGDYVLEAVAKLLKGNIRKTDLVARWGGEEFIIIFPNISGEEVIKNLNNIIYKIERQDIEYKGEILKVTISFGVSHFLKSDNHYQEALVRADKALYNSKRSGRNQVKSNF